ncbi:MAG: ROK family protein [Candidatus Eisenbacteria sp.]|nr:ROK family protein [Candidatus Eisenbacteria bacterium]
MKREAIGIDIGGTGVKLGRVDEDGKVLARHEIPTPLGSSPEEDVRHIARSVAELQGVSGKPGEAPLGGCCIGAGCAGLVSNREGVVHTSPNLPCWTEVPLAALLEHELGAPVYVLNDADAFGLAEARTGAGRGSSPVIALTLGTGVGGAIVTDGRVLGGKHGFAGEIGHMSIHLDGPPCPCGGRGCLEIYIGKRGIVSRYLERDTWRSGAPAFDLARGDREALSPKLLADAVELGDKAASETFCESGEILGAALANLTNILDPAVFVVGGGVSQAGDLILEPARRALRDRVMIREIDVPKIVRAALGVDAGLIGAAFFALDSSASRGAA